MHGFITKLFAEILQFDFIIVLIVILRTRLKRSVKVHRDYNLHERLNARLLRYQNFVEILSNVVQSFNSFIPHFIHYVTENGSERASGQALLSIQRSPDH